MLPNRYSRENLRKVLHQPSKIGDELVNLHNSARFSAHILYDGRSFRRKYGEGIEVLHQDWDNLIILDGCRWDIFKEHNNLEGESKPVISQGSSTPEFMRENFAGEQVHDTVIVTVNMHAKNVLGDDVFYSIKTTELDDENRFYSYEPERVLGMGKSAFNDHSNKRFIFHFMQPHSPYFGPIADQIRQDLREEYGFSFFIDYIREGRPLDDVWDSMGNLLNAAKGGYITRNQLETVYIENLKLVLEQVEKLLQYIDGKSVVTADHGELLGDQTSWLLPKRYGHGKRIYEPGLRIVPWHVAPYDDRRESIAEKPLRSEPVNQAKMKDTLRSLGYVQ